MNNSISNKKRSPLKERQLRYPGQSLDDEIDDLRFEVSILAGVVCIFIALALYEWVQWFRTPTSPAATPKHWSRSGHCIQLCKNQALEEAVA